MALFGTETTESPDVQAFETPKEGVVGVSPLAGARDLLDTAMNVFEGRKEQEQNQSIAQFITTQAKVADAYAQGKYKTAEFAQSVLRKNLVAAISGNPSLAMDYLKAQQQFTSLTGGGAIVKEKTLAERRRESIEDTMIEKGIVSPNATPSEMEEGYQLLRSYQEAERRYTEMNRTLDLESKTLGLSSARRTEIQEQKKELARNYVRSGAPVEFQTMRSDFDTILTGQGSETEKAEAIQDQFAAWQSTITAKLGTNLDSSEFQAMLKPFEEMRDTYLERASGALDDAEAERRVNRAITAQKLILTADPLILGTVAADSLGLDFEVFDVSLKQNVFKRFLEIQAGNSGGSETPAPSPYSIDPTNKDAYSRYIDLINSGLSKENGEGAVQHMDGLLGSLGDGEGQIRRDPKKARDIVDIIAKPSFYKALKGTQGSLQNLEDAKDVIQTHYFDEVMGMVRREFTDNNVITARPTMGGAVVDIQETPTPEAVGYRSTNSGVEFYALDPENRDARMVARELNDELKPVINTMVHAGAHLEGHNNYKQMWESMADTILGGEGEANVDGGEGTDTAPGGDAGDDLTLDSFLEGQSALDQAMTTGGFVGSGDYTDAETPEDVAASFIGFKEKEHKDVLSSFIAKTAGTNIDPSETAWCAAFVNAALGAVDKQGTGKLNARSFTNWGREVSKPQKGDVAVFTRGDPSGWQGHVGFYVGPSDREGYVRILGGNQNDTVSIKDYPESKLLGYRRG